MTQQGDLNSETEFSFLTLETGVPGMLVLIGFVVTLLYVGFTRVRRVPDREARVLLAALIAPLAAIFAQFFISASTPTVPIGPYIYAVGGIISYWLIALPAQRSRDEAQSDPSRAAGRAVIPVGG